MWNSLRSLRGRRLLAVLLAGALLIVAATSGALALVGDSGGTRITAYFDRAVAVHEGSDLRILGVTVGTVDKVEPQGKQVKVSLTVDKGVKVPQRVQAVVVAPSVVSGRFIQLSPPYYRGAQMPDGGVIPAESTATPVEVDELMQSVTELSEALGPQGVNKDGALSELIDTGAANLDGNGKAIGDTIHALGGASSVLNGNSAALVSTIEQLAEFTGMLKKNDSNVRTAAEQLGEVTSFLADDKEELASALKELGTALGQVKGFIQDNRGRIKTNVDKLAKLTQSLVNQRASIAEALDVLPLAALNLDKAYNPKTGTIDGRANINEISQAGNVPKAAATDDLQPVPESRQGSLPALPLPTIGSVYGSPEGSEGDGR